MKDATLVCAAGRPRTDSRGDARARPVNPPVERASTYLFSSYASLNEIAPTGRYGRFGTPTHRAFEESVTALEGAYATHLAPSGLMAVAGAILAFVEGGDHVLITDSVYDPVRAFADGFLQRFGVRVDYYDPCSPADAARLSNPRTKVIFAESPGSLTFEVQDVRALAQVARQSGAALIVDNTWAAGIALKPLALGARVSVQAGTKYLSGHSDVMIGAISSADAEAATRIQNSLALIGAAISPDDVALAHRGLRTLGVRFERCGDNGMQVARWLSQRPEVARVLHPALETHPQHDLWKRDFTGAAGLFAIALAPTPEPAIAAFFDALEVFGIGFSWGGYESLAVRVRPDRTRTAKHWPKADVVIRFHAGLEDVNDLVADLDRAFAAMKKTAQKTEPFR